MTEKRFNVRKSQFINEGYVVNDKEKKFVFNALSKEGAITYCKALNKLNDENEQLKCENELLRNSLEMRDGERREYE